MKLTSQVDLDVLARAANITLEELSEYNPEVKRWCTPPASETEPYVILGACNPPLAHQALQAEPDLGVLLPCNVVVYRHEGETRISAVDPERMLSIVGNDELDSVAAEVKSRLGAVVERAARWT